jgi:lipid-A-disaccharide synthase
MEHPLRYLKKERSGLNKSSNSDLYISACEASADMYGAEIIKHLLEKSPRLTISGTFGPQMRQKSPHGKFKMEQFIVMGFFDVIKALPRLISLLFRCKKEILRQNPKAILCIDYAEFHRLLERFLKKAGYKGKIFHFVAPSVWAWRKKRADQLGKACDELFTLFPFEKSYFSHTPLHVTHVGHPLKTTISRIQKKNSPYFLSLFPGSRPHEIARNLPRQLAVAKELHQKYQIPVAICLIDSSWTQKVPSFVQIFDSKDKYKLMGKSLLAIATSGTICLELALFEVPTVVTFSITKRDLFLAQKIFRIQMTYYALPNIILRKKVFPELFGPHLSYKNLYYYTERYFLDKNQRDLCINRCKELVESLGEKSPYEKITERVLSAVDLDFNRLLS